MKTKFFVIIGIAIVSIGSFSALFQIQLTDVAPCFNKELNHHIPCSPDDSIQFYEYKGEEWMEAKKQELFAAIRNNTLHEWWDLTKEDHSHWNVYMYYSATGELEELTKELETEPDIWDYENDEWSEKEEPIPHIWDTGVGVKAWTAQELECYSFFHCAPSKDSFEGCISSKKDGVTIEEFCKNPDITIDGGCVHLKLDENTTMAKCQD